MKKTITILGLLLLTTLVFGQEKPNKFEPSGKVFAKIFANFNSTFANKMSHTQFEIQRAYFGYKYQMSESFSGKINIDIADPGVGKLQMTAYLKNAYLQYKHNNVKIQFGLIGMNQFHLQEEIWGKRYLAKSFQDEYKFGASADLGASIEYKPNSIISLDATISNGEGYKSIEADSVLKYSIGMTATPIKSLNIRLYYDLMGTDTIQQNIALFVGYNIKKLQIGTELNYNLNFQMSNNHNLNGVSVYGSYKLNKFKLFGRYDKLSSNKLSGDQNEWNLNKNGEKIIAGIEYSPIKNIKISPNYQLWLPKNGNNKMNIVYLSCQVKF